jgi:2-haloacid dehalogenase
MLMLLSSIEYISFDCYGTLTNFQIGKLTKKLFADRIPENLMSEFLIDYSAFRFDEVLGAWKPYYDVLQDALARTCNKWTIDFTKEDAEVIYEMVPTWGAHFEVPGALEKIATVLPLVILSNAADEQIQNNVNKLGVSFHSVLTAEQAGAYKPRLQAFEYMFDSLNSKPEHFLHVSSSLRYDLMSAHDLKISTRVFVDRGHGPGCPAFEYYEIKDLWGLPALLGV